MSTTKTKTKKQNKKDKPAKIIKKRHIDNHKSVITFSALYIIISTVLFIEKQNYEFLLYVGVLLFFFFLIFGTLHKTKFDNAVLWLLSVWGLLHMAGGGLVVNGAVLYKLPILHIYGVGEWTIFKYDQIIHAFGFFTATLVVHHLLRQKVGQKMAKTGLFMFVAVLAGMGLGVVNEIIEFIATIVIPETNVGGYVNTSLDLVFNTIGAIIGGIVAFEKK